jgi:hypothetical protein
MMPGIEMPVFQLPIKVFGLGRELQEVLQQALFPQTSTFEKQRFFVVRLEFRTQ